ncbi:MAG: hypothetical protein DRH90_25545 [Deltaproteobacteria bacterium]|nr:MAG: hypothetical protein DRH90_25545 [Deltaproteobacteria bacterium]
MSTENNKVRVYAPIDVQSHVAAAAQEKAALEFPEEKQGDLQYIRSIMVSAGTNKNGAHFLPSEMMKAHNTVVHKAIDIEHEEERVIGHIYDCAFMYKDGTQFNPQQVMAEYNEANRDADELDIDIAVAGVIHKMRFPEYSEEIASGDWKVSMECYFKQFDLLIGGNTIITRDEAQAMGYDPNDLIGGFVKVVAGNRALGKHLVARVLRDITFSGMGIVKNPANPHSIIMETAAHREQMERSELVVDLEHIDNMRGNNKINLREDASNEKKEAATEVSVVTPEGEVADEKIFIEVDPETGGISRILSVGGQEDAAIRWSGPGAGGPGSNSSYPDALCKSFKKRVTKFNAIDQSEAVVVHEHWCAAFEEACPVIGASAKAPECLRNVNNRTVRDERDDTLTKTVREVVDGTPGNTFQTVLQQPAVVNQASASADRQDDIARLRKDTEDLRTSLRSYLTASTEKKTSK